MSDMYADDFDWYELDENISDEHMAQIARFRGLPPFNRKEWLVMRGYVRWRRAEWRAQKEKNLG